MRVCFLVMLGTITTICASDARDAQPATISVAINQVKIDNRIAKAGDVLNYGETLRAGVDSLAEVVLPDKTVVRLLPKSAFSFKGRRDLRVSEGAVLLQTPRRARGARLVDGEVAVATTGTTIVFERNATTYKLLVLQGTARLYRPKHLGDSMLVEPGQMVIANPDGELSDAVDFDDARLLQTCRLVTQFAALPNAAAIARDAEVQARAKKRKQLTATNLVISGGGTDVTVTNEGKIDNVATTNAPATQARGIDSLGAIDAAHSATTTR